MEYEEFKKEICSKNFLQVNLLVRRFFFENCEKFRSKSPDKVYDFMKKVGKTTETGKKLIIEVIKNDYGFLEFIFYPIESERKTKLSPRELRKQFK